MDKLNLSERDICTKFITPALLASGWGQDQFREEVITEGRITVRGHMAARETNPDRKGGPKRADYVLYASPKISLAVIEAKQNKFGLGHGMQQALAYAEMLDCPFAISSNCNGFLIHDRTGLSQPPEWVLTEIDEVQDQLRTELAIARSHHFGVKGEGDSE
jgi:type I restriction enzyme R subunit